MARHVIKYTHRDGNELLVPEVWCGSKTTSWRFVDAQHAALAKEQGSFIQPCKKCCKAIIRALEESK